MKFKLDENLPIEIIADLRAAGHDAVTVPDQGLTGAHDPTLIERAKREARILLTMDKGIANVRAYPPQGFAGIILFRPRASGRGSVLAFVREHLPSMMVDLVEKSTHDTRKLEMSKLLGVRLPVPPVCEQRRIVAELDALRAKVDELKRLQAETAAELDALLPSILDKAFKGKL